MWNLRKGNELDCTADLKYSDRDFENYNDYILFLIWDIDDEEVQKCYDKLVKIFKKNNITDDIDYKLFMIRNDLERDHLLLKIYETHK